MTYATVEDIEIGSGTFDESQRAAAEQFLEDAAVIIDHINPDASDEIKKLVSCRMVKRAVSDAGNAAFPIGATQGSVSALSYTQSWTNANGYGELYLTRFEKGLLGSGNKIGASNPFAGGCK